MWKEERFGLAEDNRVGHGTQPAGGSIHPALVTAKLAGVPFRNVLQTFGGLVYLQNGLENY